MPQTESPKPHFFDEKFSFTHKGMTHEVFRVGAIEEDRPAVLLMHEGTGLTPPTIAFAHRLREDGFTVFLPLFFGQPGDNTMRHVIGVCIRREIQAFAQKRTSPIAGWLRGLCRYLDTEFGRQRIGVIGMCMSGGFVLSTIIEKNVFAPVVSQPGFPIPISHSSKSALGIHPKDLQAARSRVERENIDILAFRFSADKYSPPERFCALADAFGPHFLGTEITSPDPKFGIEEDAHSILSKEYSPETDHPTQKAYQSVVKFLREKL